MDVAKIPIGRKPPDDVNVIVEIPQGGEPVKYELDKEKAPADPPRVRFLFPDMGSAARIADVSSRPWPLKRRRPYGTWMPGSRGRPSHQSHGR
jgi:hypothetical protein